MLTLVLTVVPYLARLQRAAMIDVLDSEYVQMARLKGVRERRVIRRHALRNARRADHPGLGAHADLPDGRHRRRSSTCSPSRAWEARSPTAVQSRDLPVVQAIVLLFAASYVIFNLLADVLTVYSSPRLRTRFRAVSEHTAAVALPAQRRLSSPDDGPRAAVRTHAHRHRPARRRSC